MKILWITNIMMPPICKKIGIDEPVVGGWMYSSVKSLLSTSHNLDLAIATVYSGNEFVKHKVDEVTYYLLPLHQSNFKYNFCLEPLWKRINQDFTPDIVHLHGTEYAHGLAFLKACPNVKSVVSIQGLVSVIARYYSLGMSQRDKFFSVTIRDLLTKTISQTEKSYYKRGLLEKEIIKHSQHIIGRTSWDKAHTWAINPSAQYHFCNETLREIFYTKKWTYEECEPYTIFLSQAGYPLKGLHILLKAIPLVKRKFPNVKIYIAGNNIIDTSTLKSRLKITGYGKYIKTLIKKYELNGIIKFTGPLDENEMCHYYLRSNVFVCPSSLENSPNSLGEAQLLGMPSIAAYVGGIPDLMKGFEQWMYRYDEIEVLAQKICKIFEMGKFANFSNKEALMRHNKNINAEMLYKIYLNIIGE